MKAGQLLLPMTALLPGIADAQQQGDRPNIMLIVVDDMGYSDLECFGGEVHSPNLNGLAENGVRFTQFFNSGRSCPSRAQLLTGRYAQTVGITGMGQSLTKDCVTIPEVLRQAGYHTGMSGKWHLSLVHNEEPIFTESIPSDFYYADFVADKAIDMMDEMTADGRPFFMYVAFQEPHWPVQAKPQDIAKYKGVYDEGWDVLRERRYQKMVMRRGVQTYAAVNGTNHRSFWTLEEVNITTGIYDFGSKANGKRSKANGQYDLQGRSLKSISRPGIYVVGGKKVIR